MKKIKELSVAIVTAVCMLFLGYVASFSEAKYNFIISNLPFFVFFVYLINSKKIITNNKNIIFWSSAIIFVTIVSALVYIL